MSTKTHPAHRAFATALRIASFFFVCAMPVSVPGAPPSKRQPRVVREIEKVGDFFFKVARKLEQSGFPEDAVEPRYHAPPPRTEIRRAQPSAETARPSTGLALPPGYRAYPMPEAAAARRSAPAQPQPMLRSEGFTPPNFQPNPQPHLTYPRQLPQQPQARSSLSIPVSPNPQGSASERRNLPLSGAGPFDPPATPPARGSASAPAEEAKRAMLPAVPDQPPFATPVPGRRGFVYPPGVEHELKNMVDVRDFDAGQKVRDPRSGNVFLVPPR